MTDIVSLAIEDARSRRQAVIELIRFQDQQAMTLFGIYATLSVACISGAAGSLAAKSEAANLMGAALSGPAIVFAVGCYYCYRALQTTKITLPGREGNFWHWAAEHEVTPDDVARRYIEAIVTTDAENDETNYTTSIKLTNAKICGPTAPLSSLIAVATFVTSRWLFGL